MTRIVVVTPTYRYGGLDINYDSIIRQDHQPEAWVIGDDLCEWRWTEVEDRTDEGPVFIDHFQPRPKPEGYFSDLSWIYNAMLERAFVDHKADLVVSMQDYLWIDGDGLRLFAQVHEGLVEREGRGGLITGLCSICGDPPVEDVVDPEGPWTVYEEPYDGRRPETVIWRDVRLDTCYSGQDVVQPVNPVAWELNWAAIPRWLWEEGCRFDEAYGAHIGHENSAFACVAMFDHGATCWIDPRNRALTMPHKRYWPEQEKDGLPHAEQSMKVFWSEFGERLGRL